MAIVSCTCGVKVRLPEGAAGKTLRCPKCKADLVTTVDARVLSSYRAEAGAKEATCPICQSGIATEEPVVTCPNCDQVHHRDCWTEIGGCSTYGCEQAPAATKEAPASVPLTAWGDTKACPACGETIKSIALRCRYCGTDFDTVDPLQTADLRKGVRKAENLRKLQTTVVVLFVMAVPGILAPLVVVLSLAILWPKRQLLAKAGPVYLVLGYSTVGLSVVYSMLMLMFVLAG